MSHPGERNTINGATGLLTGTTMSYLKLYISTNVVQLHATFVWDEGGASENLKDSVGSTNCPWTVRKRCSMRRTDQRTRFHEVSKQGRQPGQCTGDSQGVQKERREHTRGHVPV